MPDTPNKFYLTTPIYYVNARPHIGHAYSTIAADVIARRHRLLGDDTFFLTGTDEHGQKVQRASLAAGVSPQEYADEVSASFRNLWKRMGITNDDYIRTTEERHKRGVQHLWRVLEERGAIYLSSYTGQYCVSEEMFVDGPSGTIGPDGKPTETVTEENYFFRLSDYQEKLIHLIESGELHIQPETARNEVLSFIRGGLKDLSISRTTFDWGIPVPTNPKHVVYVWLDALANYITAIGYGAEDRDDLSPEQKQAELAKFAKYWPADIHLVGKEITRFHCVYWPAFLMAAGIPPPKSVVANGWLLFEESKMSKSRGNVVRTETILDAFGPLCPPLPVTQESASLKGTASAVPKTSSKKGGALAPEGIASRSSSGLQAAEKGQQNQGALAPGLAAPTKAQQDLFAADVLRYFLLREIPFGQDGSFSFDALITRYNADLANGYGNLVSRVLTMIEKYFDGRIPQSAYGLIGIVNFIDGIDRIGGANDRIGGTNYGAIEFQYKLDNALELSDFSTALELTQQFIKHVDQFLSVKKPWKLNAENPDERIELEHTLYAAADAVKNITFLLHPFMPYCTGKVWQQLGIGISIEDTNLVPEMVNLRNLKWGDLQPGTKLGPLAPIFPRADKGLAQIMTDMENPTTPAAAEPAKPAADPSAPTPEALNAVNPTAAVPAPAAPATSPAPTDNSQLRTDNSPLITIDDFAKVDLRVAQIVVAERIPKADKLLRLEVDLGPSFDPPRRQILAGIAEHYAPEALIGRKVVIVANLAPRKMRGLESQGMIVAASVGPNGAPVLTGFLEDVELGARLK